MIGEEEGEEGGEEAPTVVSLAEVIVANGAVSSSCR
jgi:hypothetical protein